MTESGQRDYGGGGNVISGRYFGSLPSATLHMVQGQDNMRNGAAREGREVPDGLHYGVQLVGFPEGGRPRPRAQLRQVHGNGVPVRRLHKG